MKILIGSYYSGGTGADRVKTFLANEWVRQGNDVTILSLDDANGYYNVDNLIRKVVLHVQRKIKGVNIFEEILALRKFFSEERFEVMIFFAGNFSVKCMLALIGLKNSGRIIISERNDPAAEEKDILNHCFRNWAFAHADALVFQTLAARDYYSNDIKNKSVIIPNPINQGLPNYKGKREKRIIAVGRLERQKNIPMLLEAFSLFHQDYKDYQLEIYGDGTLRNQIEKMISDYSLENCVKLCGFCTDIWSRVYKAAMYVSASNYEGISNAMLEALVMGIPTVVTDCPAGGERMFIKHKVNGLLVDVGDTNGLYHAMKYIVEHPLEAKRMSNESIKIKTQLSPQFISEKWMKICRNERVD